MNWNIEQLSIAKLNKPGFATAIARVVNAANVDVLVVLEVKSTQVHPAMTILSTALNGGAGGNNWRGYFLSRRTGGEYYCVFIRNLDVVRPLYPVQGIGPAGTANNRLNNLERNVFFVWPSPNWGVSAYSPPPAILPPNHNFLPLIDVYASAPLPRAAKKANTFAGQTAATGGYSLGRGYRLPGLALLMVHSAVANYLIPIVICHYASKRSGANLLAASQIGQLKDLHLSQLFNFNPPPAVAGGAPGADQSGYIDVRNAVGAHTAWPIRDLILTGDFNLDFLDNVAGGTAVQTIINNGYNPLTSTVSGGGSAVPAAASGMPGPLPALPFAGPFPPGPLRSTVKSQNLRAAVTTQGTIMFKLPKAAPLPPLPAAGPPPAPYTTSALDNFLYGGLVTTSAPANQGVGAVDSGRIVNIPADVVNAGAAGAPHQLDLAGLAAAYAAQGTKNAILAPFLQAPAGPGAVLTPQDRLIGARLLSDHLPVVLTFTCP